MMVGDLAVMRILTDLISWEQKAAAAQEVPISAHIEELPDDDAAAAIEVSPDSKEGTNAKAGAEDPNQKRTRGKRMNNGRRNKVGWAKALRQEKIER